MVRNDRLNVLIHHYGDLDLLREAVASVPDGLPVHVVDGRFVNFGDADLPDLTPGTREFCGRHPDAHYHAPPEDRLPFGVEFDAADHLRPGVHAKARYSYYEVLPDDEWAFQIDTDERVLDLDLSVLDALDPEKRYTPAVEWAEGERRLPPHTIPRITVPKYWTLWIDDCGVPRDELHRERPLPETYDAWRDHFGPSDRYEHLPEFRIRNLGTDARPETYNKERVRHLYDIGRPDRAAHLARTLWDDVDRVEQALHPGRE